MWIWLVGAIVSEVIATLALRLSEGFTKILWTGIAILGYIVAFYLLAQGLTRGLPLGVAYGIWAASGVALIAILSVPIFGESLSWIQIGGIALVIGGVLALELGGNHSDAAA